MIDYLNGKKVNINTFFNGYFRKYWRFISKDDIVLLKGYDKLKKELI